MAKLEKLLERGIGSRRASNATSEHIYEHTPRRVFWYCFMAQFSINVYRVYGAVRMKFGRTESRGKPQTGASARVERGTKLIGYELSDTILV